MIKRLIQDELIQSIGRNPAVVLLGPRQVGKTTLALEIARTRPSLYLDLETAPDRAKLADPERYLADHEDVLVILDEAHRAPDLFQNLRGLIDSGRRRGKLLQTASNFWFGCQNSPFNDMRPRGPKRQARYATTGET